MPSYFENGLVLEASENILNFVQYLSDEMTGKNASSLDEGVFKQQQFTSSFDDGVEQHEYTSGLMVDLIERAFYTLHIAREGTSFVPDYVLHILDSEVDVT